MGIVDKDLLTPKDVARRWNIHVKTLSNWRQIKRGPAYLKLGEGRSTRVLYRAADIERYEQAHLRPSTQVSP